MQNAFTMNDAVIIFPANHLPWRARCAAKADWVFSNRKYTNPALSLFIGKEANESKLRIRNRDMIEIKHQSIIEILNFMQHQFENWTHFSTKICFNLPNFEHSPSTSSLISISNSSYVCQRSNVIMWPWIKKQKMKFQKVKPTYLIFRIKHILQQ